MAVLVERAVDRGHTHELDRYDAADPYFQTERPGYEGYIEWEKYPERKEKAAELLAKGDFVGPPEFQLEPLPKTNPVLEGVRWKQYHAAMGPTLVDEPARSWEIVQAEKAPDMRHVLEFPYNGEPPHDRLVSTPITRNEDHFVRNHGGIPRIDAEQWSVDIEGLVNKPQRLTLADLQDESKFPRQTNTVTLQCAGARRMAQIRACPGGGDELLNAPWLEGAIGTAIYKGVSLKKVIKFCGGLKDGAKHLEFTGADTYFKRRKAMNYVVSVPYRKVKMNEVLLAWEMNGKPLPKIHGYPLRVVVFGYIGARSVKWLTRIAAIERESMAPVQSQEYIHYGTQFSKYNSSYSDGFSVQDMPVASAIMTPVDFATIVHDGHIRLTGWAYSGSGQWPMRVELSVDGGSVWYEVPYTGLSEKKFHAWRTWEMEMPIDAEGWVEVCVRCWDSACNTQPAQQKETWNFELHVNSAIHRIRVFSINRSRPATARRLLDMEAAGEPITPVTRPLEIVVPQDGVSFQAEVDKRGGRDPLD